MFNSMGVRAWTVTAENFRDPDELYQTFDAFKALLAMHGQLSLFGLWKHLGNSMELPSG